MTEARKKMSGEEKRNSPRKIRTAGKKEKGRVGGSSFRKGGPNRKGGQMAPLQAKRHRKSAGKRKRRDAFGEEGGDRGYFFPTKKEWEEKARPKKKGPRVEGN